MTELVPEAGEDRAWERVASEGTQNGAELRRRVAHARRHHGLAFIIEPRCSILSMGLGIGQANLAEPSGNGSIAGCEGGERPVARLLRSARAHLRDGRETVGPGRPRRSMLQTSTTETATGAAHDRSGSTAVSAQG